MLIAVLGIICANAAYARAGWTDFVKVAELVATMRPANAPQSVSKEVA